MEVLETRKSLLMEQEASEGSCTLKVVLERSPVKVPLNVRSEITDYCDDLLIK